MKINALILTTAPTIWFNKDLPFIAQNLKQAKGVESVSFDVEHITLGVVPTRKDEDGDIKPSWDWYTANITAKAKGYNAVILHISRAEKRMLGITVNGTYRADSDEIFECWISADKGRSQHYEMSEFSRLVIHELGGHGFERFTYGHSTNYTHEYDYELKQLPNLTRIMDFTEWTRLREERDRLAGVRNSLLRAMLQKLIELKARMDKPIYPIDESYFLENKISQGFFVYNPRYASHRHMGTDFKCPIGTEVRAPADGQITVRFGDHPTLGGYVQYSCVIGNVRYWFRFLHLSKSMPIGPYKKGDLIGLTGNTGESTGPHLHLDGWTCVPNPNKIQNPAGVKTNMFDVVEFFKKHVDNL